MIRIRNGAILDQKQRAVLDRIGFYTDTLILEVTRGHSTPIEQLGTITKLAADNGVKRPEFVVGDLHTKVTIDGKELYTWQRTWSWLLHIGVIVNPPLIAECVEEYNGEKGRVINPSPHILSDPIDFSGGDDIDRVYDVLSRAKSGNVGIRNLKLERVNHCVHVDLFKEIDAREGLYEPSDIRIRGRRAVCSIIGQDEGGGSPRTGRRRTGIPHAGLDEGAPGVSKPMLFMFKLRKGRLPLHIGQLNYLLRRKYVIRLEETCWGTGTYDRHSPRRTLCRSCRGRPVNRGAGEG